MELVFDWQYLLLLFLLGNLAGFINVMAGGGSVLILPLLLFMGLDASVANGTNRIAIFALTLSAITSMKRENVSDFKLSWKMAAFTLPGAIIGAILAQDISNELFKTILAWVMIGILFMIILPKSKKRFLIDKLKHYPKIIYPVMIAIGFYGGFIQVGVGFLLMLGIQSILDLSLLKVNMHKVFIVFVYTIPALAIFIFQGNVNLILGLVLASGMGLGAWWSAKVAIKKGDGIIRLFLILSIILISMKLFNIY